ncbi:MAG: hypothetical protein KTR31_39260 [Myxococcales bacterium]|nr:hypothetical protein [Myxococcales bacterium]
MMRRCLVVVLGGAVACAGESPTTPPKGPTWHQGVASILEPSCGACHRPGGIQADIDLTTFEGAYAWREAIGVAVAARTMPPFPAGDSDQCEMSAPFVDDPRLSDAEIATVVEWVQRGAPEGEPEEAWPVPSPEVSHLERIDQQLRMPQPVAVPPSSVVRDRILCVVMDPMREEPGWLQGVEVLVDNASVVHHVRLNLTERSFAAERDASDGQIDGTYLCKGRDYTTPIGGYAPGMGPQVYPAGSGIRITPDDVVVAAIHYHMADDAQVDDTQVALQWARGEAVVQARIFKTDTARTAEAGLLPGPGDDGEVEFRIPAGAANHTETTLFEVPQGLGPQLRVFSTLGHMHYVGSSFRMWVERADGSQGPCLLSIPQWDFDWQLFYDVDLEEPGAPVLAPGDQIYVECTYDNTLTNPEVARILEEEGLSEPRDFTYGTSSNAEMCSMMIGVVPGEG